MPHQMGIAEVTAAEDKMKSRAPWKERLQIEPRDAIGEQSLVAR